MAEAPVALPRFTETLPGLLVGEVMDRRDARPSVTFGSVELSVTASVRFAVTHEPDGMVELTILEGSSMRLNPRAAEALAYLLVCRPAVRR